MQLAPTVPKDTKSLPNHKFACLGTRKVQTDHTNTWAVANAQSLGISYADVTDVTNIQEKTAEEFDADDSLITTKENKIAKKS